MTADDHTKRLYDDISDIDSLATRGLCDIAEGDTSGAAQRFREILEITELWNDP